MNHLYNLITNPFILTACTSWLLAQIIKTIIHTVVNKDFDITRLFGDGGMPSGHSATVSSLAVLSAMVYGTGSYEFAISAILTLIVCHDAMGVRLETGKQAVVLNEIIKSFSILGDTTKLPEVKLKEFVGHTPIQVAAGILLGCINAVIMYFILI